MYLWLHYVFQYHRHVLNIARTENIILLMTIVLISSHAVRRVARNDAHLLTHNLSDAKAVPLHYTSGVYVVSGASKSQCLDGFPHYSPTLLAQSGNAACLLSSTISLFFMFCAPVPASASYWDLYVFRSLNVVCTHFATSLSDLYRFIISSGSAHPAAENSNNQFLYEVVNCGCE